MLFDKGGLAGVGGLSVKRQLKSRLAILTKLVFKHS